MAQFLMKTRCSNEHANGVWCRVELTKEKAAKFLRWKEIWKLASTGAGNLYKLTFWSMPDALYNWEFMDTSWPEFSSFMDENDIVDMPRGFPLEQKAPPRGDCYVVEVHGDRDTSGVTWTWCSKYGSGTFITNELTWEVIQQIYDGTYEPTTYAEEE